MKTRWALLSACLVLAGLGLAGAVTHDPVPVVPAANVDVVSNAAPAADAYAATPTAVSTIAPPERKSCQVFASDCVFDGGPCGPVPNTCHCQFRPTGWICAR